MSNPSEHEKNDTEFKDDFIVDEEAIPENSIVEEGITNLGEKVKVVTVFRPSPAKLIGLVTMNRAQQIRIPDNIMKELDFKTNSTYVLIQRGNDFIIKKQNDVGLIL